MKRGQEKHKLRKSYDSLTKWPQHFVIREDIYFKSEQLIVRLTVLKRILKNENPEMRNLISHPYNTYVNTLISVARLRHREKLVKY